MTTSYPRVTSTSEPEPQIRGVRLQPNSTGYDNAIEGTVQVLVDNR